MDAIFKALNDPARRALLDMLRARDGQTLTELEEQLDMSRFGVMKHLKVLEEAHLVTTRRAGRFKHHYLNALPLQEVIDRWIEPLLKPRVRALSHLKTSLERTTPMTRPDFVMSTYIRCSQDALWEALVDAEAYSRWDFLGQTAQRDGDTVTYRTPDGTETLQARDLEVVPKTRLVTSFEPKWDDVTTPSRVVYLIEPEGDFCKLTVEHWDLNNDPEGGTADGWTRSLAGLKTYLESGQAANFGGSYLWEQQGA
ncbi:ArsR/SmtB family transcription factor [Wenxinia saemankumensis]|uniref:Transcriptional regulator, ArsR family n=1 Tax=Wenxinia saemankumensis TaxID=1447782 RepID=A0A1M6CF69_9RHOB|nr:metalloregulator ArsR/SmtB family transcription factor [Wenxinia saemankumensis]SHI59563.1 transcriptional regulator, ArsR family [Wenxinia saemankumensis]